MRQLEIKRQETKGDWEGSQVVEHLGILMDTVGMVFYVLKWKEKLIRSMATS